MLELIQDEPLSLFQLPFMRKNQIHTFLGDICQARGQGSHHECPTYWDVVFLSINDNLSHGAPRDSVCCGEEVGGSASSALR